MEVMMLKQGLLAAGMALAGSAPALAQVQISPAPPPPASVERVVTTPSPSTTIIVAPNPPPAPRAENPPPPSMPDLVWKPGHWAWNTATAQYDWIDGTYVERPARMAKFTPGYWQREPNGWMWVDGHWN